MHIITECSKCGVDFMYHSTDYNLERDITLVDEFGNNEIIATVICQFCDEFEKRPNHFQNVYCLDGYNIFKKDVYEYWSLGDINELEADGVILIDSKKYTEEGLLKEETMRVLTEKEFNSRFNKL